MADRFFYPPQVSLERTQLVNLEGVVDVSDHHRAVCVDNAVMLDENVPSGIGFVKDSKYIDQLHKTTIAAVFVQPDMLDRVPSQTLGLACENPRLCFARVVKLLYPFVEDAVPAERTTTLIDSSVQLGKNVRLGHGVVIGKNASLGDHCHVGDYTVIADHCRIGHNARIGRFNHLQYSIIGNDFMCGNHNSIGARGFAFEPTRTGMFTIPQLGLLRIGHGVRISDGCSVDRGALGDTLISDHVQIESQCKIGHNTSIGAFTVMTGQVAIAGSTKIGNGVRIAGKVGFKGFITVGDGAIIMAHSAVTKDVPKGQQVFGVPAMPYKDFVARQYVLNKLTRNKQREQ